nr:MAG TPA: hypothetical protein [Caudoviricetes sp.]
MAGEVGGAWFWSLTNCFGGRKTIAGARMQKNVSGSICLPKYNFQIFT